MSVELDNDEGSDVEVDEDEPEPPIPDEPVMDEEELEEVSNAPEDLELGDEPPCIPEGWAPRLELPSGSLTGKKIMFRWDCGWEVGLVKNRINRGQYNYFVRYKEPDGSIDMSTVTNWWPATTTTWLREHHLMVFDLYCKIAVTKW